MLSGEENEELGLGRAVLQQGADGIEEPRAQGRGRSLRDAAERRIAGVRP